MHSGLPRRLRGETRISQSGKQFRFYDDGEILIIPPFVILNNLPIDSRILGIIGVAILGTLGFVSVGTIFR